MSADPNCRALRAYSSRSSRCCAPTDLPSHRNRRRRSWPRSSCSGPAAWKTFGTQPSQRWPLHRSVAQLSTGCSICTFAETRQSSASRRRGRRDCPARRRPVATTSRCCRTRPMSPASQLRAPKPWSSAALRSSRPPSAAPAVPRGAGRLPKRRGLRRMRARARPVCRLAPHLARLRSQRRRNSPAGAFEAAAAPTQDVAAD